MKIYYSFTLETFSKMVFHYVGIFFFYAIVFLLAYFYIIFLNNVVVYFAQLVFVFCLLAWHKLCVSIFYIFVVFSQQLIFFSMKMKYNKALLNGEVYFFKIKLFPNKIILKSQLLTKKWSIRLKYFIKKILNLLFSKKSSNFSYI